MVRLHVVILVIGLCISGCSEDANPTETKTLDYTGIYNLITIDGNNLPYTPSHEGNTLQVQSSTFILNTDAAFEMTMTYKRQSGEIFNQDFSGTYTLNNYTFTFHWQGAGKNTAALEGDSFTMNNEGLLFLYRKQ